MRNKQEQLEEHKKQKQESKTQTLYKVVEDLLEQQKSTTQINNFIKDKLLPAIQNLNNQVNTLNSDLDEEKKKNTLLVEV